MPYLPSNRFFPRFLKKFVRFAKMLVSEPIASVGTQWRWMSRSEYMMLFRSNQSRFLFSKTSP